VDEAAVRALADRVVAGAMPPMELAVRAHRAFGHGTLDLAQRVVELADADDCVEDTDMTEHDVDVTAEARRIVEETLATRPALGVNQTLHGR
jgi:hypothetical protein